MFTYEASRNSKTLHIGSCKKRELSGKTDFQHYSRQFPEATGLQITVLLIPVWHWDFHCRKKTLCKPSLRKHTSSGLKIQLSTFEGPPPEQSVEDMLPYRILQVQMLCKILDLPLYVYVSFSSAERFERLLLRSYRHFLTPTYPQSPLQRTVFLIGHMYAKGK